MRQSGLCDVQSVGGAGQPAAILDRADGAEMAELQMQLHESCPAHVDDEDYEPVSRNRIGAQGFNC